MKAIKERGNGKLRALDRYIGIPLILFLGLLRRKSRAVPEDPRVIGCLITTAIGDTILNMAAIQLLRKRYPKARLVGFCSDGNRSIAAMVSAFDEVVPIPVTSPVAAVRKLRGFGPIDIWIDFGPWPRINAIYSHFSRSALKIGFRAEGQFRHYAYDRVARHDLGRHEVENYLALLAPLGIQGKERPRLQAEAGAPMPNAIVAHVFPGGSRHYLKVWPESHWLELFDGLARKGYEIYLTGSLADRPKLERLAAKSGSADSLRIVAGTHSLRETANLISRSAATISVDTGVLHLASALGADLVALHGPTSPKRWGALNENAVSLVSGLTCSPCVSIGYEKGCGVNRCMQAISPERVLAALDGFRSERGPRPEASGIGVGGSVDGSTVPSA